MAYSPAFQFYPGEYLGDKNTIPMTTLENGAYCLLMWVCWEQDGLLDDLEELADVARMSVEDFEPIWKRRIKKCFVFDEKKKRFFHPRHLKEIKKQKAWKREKSAIGLKGAESRWGKRTSKDGKGMPKHAKAMPTDASLSPISSSSLSSEDFKRLILHARGNFPNEDPRLVEIGVLYTMLQRNGSSEPIKSAKYFTPEIVKACKDAKGMASKTIDALLARRREQLWEMQGREEKLAQCLD